MEPIRIILVEDHSLVREGIRMILENDDGIQVVGEAGNINEAIKAITAAEPDVILLDLNLGDESSLDHLQKIVEASPGSRILVLTGIIDEETNRRAAAGGVHGLVLKNNAAAILLTALKKVHQGQIWFDRSLTARLLDDARTRNQAKHEGDKLLDSLTSREHQIVALIAEGLVNKDIAVRLSITEKTVRNALTVVYNKLGVSNRLELAIFASRNGIGS